MDHPDRGRQAASRAALIAFREVLSCITSAWLPEGYALGLRRLSTREPIALRGRHGFGFRVTIMQEHNVTAVGDSDDAWRVSTAGYAYTLLLTTGAELLAFHWHPRGISPAKFPHLHIGSAIITKNLTAAFPRPIAREFSDAHIPTGPIALRALVAFLVEELGVAPLRPNWHDILDRVDETFALDPLSGT